MFRPFWGYIKQIKNWKITKTQKVRVKKGARKKFKHLKKGINIRPNKPYLPNIYANINGATIVASDSTINLGVSISNLPQVIFSFGTAPE